MRGNADEAGQAGKTKMCITSALGLVVRNGLAAQTNSHGPRRVAGEMGLGLVRSLISRVVSWVS